MDTSPLSSLRDSTAFAEFGGDRYDTTPFFFGLDTANGYLIVGLSNGLQVWTTNNSPADPSLLGAINVSQYPFQSTNPELKWPLQDVSVPADTDSLAVQTGFAGLGTTIFDLSNKSSPRIAYQNSEHGGAEVYAATIAGVHYAFTADNDGLFSYNMDNAVAFGPCSEDVAGSSCFGVFMGRVGTRQPLYIHGVDQFLVASSGAGSGFDIWDISDPGAPQLKLSALNYERDASNNVTAGMPVDGVALWRDNGRYYLALRSTPGLGPQAPADNFIAAIYDVSCISSSCGQLGSSLWVRSFPEAGSGTLFTTFSRSTSAPFLYLGGEDRCTGVLQREWLLDISNPSSPRDITPPAQTLLIDGTPTETGYWGWYYRGNQTGFNLVMPRKGKFSGDYFYRAALGILDIHSLVGTPPVAAFGYSPATIYTITPVQFIDQSTGRPTSWTWTFSGGSPASSNAQNPSSSFSAAGNHNVTLKSCNAAGCTTSTQVLTVLNPAPVITSATSHPSPVYLGDTLTLSATATGKPPLSFSWVITDGPTLTGSTATWTASGATGYRQVRLTVTNSTTSATYNLYPSILDPKPVITGLSVTPSTATVGYEANFHASATGRPPLTFSWAIANGPTLFGNDLAWPPAEPLGTRGVTLTVTNTAGVAASSTSLTVTNNFLVFFGPRNCPRDLCLFSTYDTVAFDLIGGGVLYEYDWDGNGSFDESSANPIEAHQYPASGYYVPRVRITANGTSQTIASSQPISVNHTDAPYLDVATSFFTLPPYRALDTRQPKGPSGGPALATNATRTISVSTAGQVPANAAAVAVNLTAANATDAGYLQATRPGASFGDASILSFSPGRAIASNAILPTNFNASFDLAPHFEIQDLDPSTRSSVDVLVDLVGYFAPAPAFYTVTPCRLLDTRGIGAPVLPLRALSLTFAGACGIPASATALALTLTVATASSNGTLRATPGNLPFTPSSVLSFEAGTARSNSLLLKVGPQASLKIEALFPDGSPMGALDLLIDLAGFFD